MEERGDYEWKEAGEDTDRGGGGGGTMNEKKQERGWRGMERSRRGYR